MSIDRWVPLGITRSSRSLFDPSWDVGDEFWDDFRHGYEPNRRPYLARASSGSNQFQLERKMAHMEHDMDRMFSNISNLYQLTPRGDPMRPRSPMSRRHLRLHASEATRMTSSANSGAMTSSANSLSPLALRAAEEVTVEHPVVVDKSGVKKLELNFDVRAFKPDEIQVKTKDNQFLEVHAAHEEKSETGLVKREYHRMFSIPPNTQIASMKSMLSPEGVLTIEAPMKNQVALGSNQPASIAICHE